MGTLIVGHQSLPEARYHEGKNNVLDAALACRLPLTVYLKMRISDNDLAADGGLTVYFLKCFLDDPRQDKRFMRSAVFAAIFPRAPPNIDPTPIVDILLSISWHTFSVHWRVRVPVSSPCPGYTFVDSDLLPRAQQLPPLNRNSSTLDPTTLDQRAPCLHDSIRNMRTSGIYSKNPANSAQLLSKILSDVLSDTTEGRLQVASSEINPMFFYERVVAAGHVFSPK